MCPQRRNRTRRIIHEQCRTNEQHIVRKLGDKRAELFFSIPFVRYLTGGPNTIHYVKTNIMPRAVVLRSGIADADDELQNSLTSSPLFRLRPLRQQRALLSSQRRLYPLRLPS